MAKLTYVEPKGYITPTMKKILDEGNKTSKKPASKPTSKKSTKK